MNNIIETLEQRGSRYGSFEDNARITQQLLEVAEMSPNWQNNELGPIHKEAIHMIFHKIARCLCGDPNYEDNFVDIAGYATLLSDELKKEVK